MIERAEYYAAKQNVPYPNMALEEYLMDTVPRGTCILYLWQNQRTVVIGRNQNCWKECRVKELERDGGHLARRLSGGGAVYHDLGNLNFTFLVRREDYDVDRQLSVILRACRSLGIPAEKTGRNDVTAGGRKFSGNAFYFSGDCAYHHGTLLIDTDKEAAGRYLSVSVEKIRSKGVDSVQSRIANLSEFLPGLTAARMVAVLLSAFGGVYGRTPEKIEETRLDGPRLARLERDFSDPGWLYNRSSPFRYEFSRRFPWGGVTVCLDVKNGTVTDAAVYSDAMDESFIARVGGRLRGCPFSARAAVERIRSVPAEDGLSAAMRADLERLFDEQNF